MIYKDKILIIHRNSLLQERISTYLRENDFSVIAANNIENTYSLTKSLKPDIILWGESLTAYSKEILRKIKSSRYGKMTPIIAMIPDIELFDRIEIEKNGISDIIDMSPNYTDLKLKIRFHLANTRRLKQYDQKLQRLQDISELQYNLIRIQDVNRLCELVDDYIFNNYNIDSLITLVHNSKTNEYDFKGFMSADSKKIEANDSIFELPIWRQYFFTNPNIVSERVVDNYTLNLFDMVGLKSNIYYQFPLKSSKRRVGLIIIGLSEKEEFSKEQFNEIDMVSGSLAFRIVNIRNVFSGKQKIKEETTEIQNLFQRLNEDEIFNYLCRQLLNNLKADVCFYFNYNEGFRFLYPQYCYKVNSEKNLFEDEKPPVLLLKDFPTFEKYLESKKLSSHFNLNKTPASDLADMTALAGGSYKSLLIFNVKVSNEIKGFFIIANENTIKLFTSPSINEAKQMIQKATSILIESRIIRQAQQTIKQLDRVFELSKELTLDTEISDLLKKIAAAIRRTLGWNIVILDKKDLYSSRYKNICVFGLKPNEYKELKKQFPRSMYSSTKENCFEISNSYFYDHNMSESPINDIDRRKFLLSIGKEWNDEDWLFVPIQSKGRDLGYFAVNDPVERLRPSEDKVRSLEYFANQAAVVLENASLYENLKSSEIKYRLLAETMIMGLVTCNGGGKIIYINKSLTNMLNYKESKSLINQNIFDLCSDKTRLELENNILKLVKQNKGDYEQEAQSDNESIEIELLTNDNDYIPFRIYLTNYYHQSKKAGFLGVLSDLRPQRKLERLKSDFNSMIVHDLRSPLNIIQGYVDIVRNQVVGKISEEQGELLFIAKDNVDKVLKLIDNFLIASKMEAGKFNLSLETHSLNTLIESVYEHHLVLAQNKNIKMGINLDQNISLLQFDKMRIEQVMSNYISNAIKFTNTDGKIEIASNLKKELNELTGETSLAVHVCVKDTGTGIPFDEQDKVFNKYEQTEAGKDASLKGTGLGLTICKEIISLHKGKVWLESTPNKGSIFYFSLPITPLKI